MLPTPLWQVNESTEVLLGEGRGEMVLGSEMTRQARTQVFETVGYMHWRRQTRRRRVWRKAAM